MILARPRRGAGPGEDTLETIGWPRFVDNDEQGGAVYLCGAPRGGWSAEWPRLAHLDG